MLVDELWKVFENTGNLEAYLYYLKHKEVYGEEQDEIEYPVAVNENIVN